MKTDFGQGLTGRTRGLLQTFGLCSAVASPAGQENRSGGGSGGYEWEIKRTGASGFVQIPISPRAPAGIGDKGI
jgi:hypothetical protein